MRRLLVGDGISELVAGMPHELAAACQTTIDELAWRAKRAGDDRPIGMLRVGVLADLVLRPWLAPGPVAAHLRDLLTQLDAADLRTPPGGSVTFAFTDEHGALQAVATLREQRQAADADHVIPQAGGQTDCANLCCLCRRHHRLKTFAPGWTYAMTPDGILTVTAPSGVTRTSRPPGLQLTGPHVLTRPPDRPGQSPPPAPDPADYPPPF